MSMSQRPQNKNFGVIGAKYAIGIAEQNRNKYYENPKVCECCNTVIPYERRANKYCSSSCSARATATTRLETLKLKLEPETHCVCHHCNEKFKITSTTQSRRRKFCSSSCRAEHLRKIKTNERIRRGEVTTSPTLKRYVAERDGEQCSKCGIMGWNNETLVFQLDHIDGDPSNNKPDNLRLLCPNCHSQTPTFGYRNRGNGRRTRGLRP
jgi:hypothetical protein